MRKIFKPDDLANISYGQSDMKFEFDDGRVVQAKTKVKLPDKMILILMVIRRY